MTTKSQIITEVLVRLNQSTTVGYYTGTILNNWLDQAHKWAAGYKKWPFTEGRQSTTFASLATDEDGLLVGLYPEGWKPNSIRYITIGGKKVDKREYGSFREFLENNSDDSRRIFANKAVRYYVNPDIDLSGTVTVWGQYTPVMDLTDETSTTAFSTYAEEGNEAIVLKMLSYAKEKEKSPTAVDGRGRTSSESVGFHQKAIAVLEELWVRIQDEQYGEQTEAGDGIFKRFDLLKGGFKEDVFKRDQWS